MATDDEVDEFFAHHGVKGMHWGVRKAERAARDQSIRDARAKNVSRMVETNNQIVKLNLATTEKGKVAAVKAINQLQKDADESGDNKLAAQRTSGEKAASAVLITAGAVLAARILLG